jgi:hypothetical protein
MGKSRRCISSRSHAATGVARRACLFALLLQAQAALAQLQCEPLLPQKGELAYRPRGEHCEGLFIQNTSSSVRLKALVALDAAPAGEARTLSAVPLAPSSAGFRIRVQSLDPRIHYQLDGVIPASGRFSWSAAEVIDKAALRRADLAPLVWMPSQPPLYVPVSLAAPLRPAKVRAIFESAVPVEEYVARLNTEAGAAVELSARSPLPATYLEFDLPARPASGRHTFWLRVRLLGEVAPETRSWSLWLP